MITVDRKVFMKFWLYVALGRLLIAIWWGILSWTQCFYKGYTGISKCFEIYVEVHHSCIMPQRLFSFLCLGRCIRDRMFVLYIWIMMGQNRSHNNFLFRYCLLLEESKKLVDKMANYFGNVWQRMRQGQGSRIWNIISLGDSESDWGKKLSH